MLWAIIGHRLAGRTFATEAALFADVRAIWAGIEQSSINALVSSFRRRLEMCLAARGASISQLLSSHMTAPRPQDIAAVGVVPPFTPELDELLRSYVDEYGRKWTQMRRDVAPLAVFTTVLLKNRFIQLEIEERNAEFAEFNDIRLATMHREVIAVFGEFEADLQDAAAEGFVDEEGPEEPAALVGPSAWHVFARENRADCAELYWDEDARDITRRLAQEWRTLSDSEKAKYTARAPLPPAPKESGRGKKATGRPKKGK